jgi:hypothetical protein
MGAMKRSEAVTRLTPIVRRALVNAEDEVLARCGPLARTIVHPAYNLVVRHAAELLTRISVEVVVTAAGPLVAQLLREAVELFNTGEPLHPAVTAALSEVREQP